MTKFLLGWIKKRLPRPTFNFLRVVLNWKDWLTAISFIMEKCPNVSLRDRWSIIISIYKISLNVESPHTQQEILSFIRAILSLPSETKGVVVEAGCFKGSSTAKFSLAASLAGRTLVVFDSFEGIPENSEQHKKIYLVEAQNFAKAITAAVSKKLKAMLLNTATSMSAALPRDGLKTLCHHFVSQ